MAAAAAAMPQQWRQHSTRHRLRLTRRTDQPTAGACLEQQEAAVHGRVEDGISQEDAGHHVWHIACRDTQQRVEWAVAKRWPMARLPGLAGGAAAAAALPPLCKLYTKGRYSVSSGAAPPGPTAYCIGYAVPDADWARSLMAILTAVAQQEAEGGDDDGPDGGVHDLRKE